MKHRVTKIEIAHYIANQSGNESTLIPNDLQDGPPQKLLQQYVAWYQQSAQDYHPIDVESVRWLIGQSSTLRFLSLEDLDPLRPSILFFNDTINWLEALRQSICSGKRTFGDHELKDIPLFIQMEWMQNFKVPTEIMHCWSVVDHFLHVIQTVVPDANPKWMDRWFSGLRSFWTYLLKEAINHLFSLNFRSIEQIPKFQHSVYWTMFFYMFQSTDDSQEMISFKEMIIKNPVFRKGIRNFIDAVEMALHDIKPVVFSPMNVSSEDVLNGTQMDVDKEINKILDEMDKEEWYQLWWSKLFINSCDSWGGVLVDALDNNLEGYSSKEVMAASLLWDLETVVAYIEPILFQRKHLHNALLALRNTVRRYVFELILRGSWL